MPGENRISSGVRLPIVEPVHPIDDHLFELQRVQGIAEDAVAGAFDHRVDGGGRRAEVHIGDPHRQAAVGDRAPLGAMVTRCDR